MERYYQNLVTKQAHKEHISNIDNLINVGSEFENFFADTDSFPGWRNLSAREFESYISAIHSNDEKFGERVNLLDQLGIILVDAQIVVTNPFDLTNVFTIHLRSERQASPATVTGYKNDLKMIRRFLEGKKRWSGWLAISDLDIQVYLTHLADVHRQWTTINRELASLRTFFNFLLANKVVSRNPFEEIRLKSRPRNLPRYFYEPEMEQLFKAADGDGKPLDFRNRALIELLYATGMRVSECADLTLSQIDFNVHMILVHGKGNKDRYVPFGRYAEDSLNKYFANCRDLLMSKYNEKHDYVFINHYGKRITSEGIEYILNQIIKRSSLNSHIHPHMLRHSFATAMLNNGADIRSVQELLGHASLSTTQIYTHVTSESLQKSYQKFFPRARRKG